MQHFRLAVIGCAFAVAVSTGANAEERLFWAGNGGLITLTTPTGPSTMGSAYAQETGLDSSIHSQKAKKTHARVHSGQP